MIETMDIKPNRMIYIEEYGKYIWLNTGTIASIRKVDKDYFNGAVKEYELIIELTYTDDYISKSFNTDHFEDAEQKRDELYNDLIKAITK